VAFLIVVAARITLSVGARLAVTGTRVAAGGARLGLRAGRLGDGDGRGGRGPAGSGQVTFKIWTRFDWAKDEMHKALEGALDAAADTATRSAKRRAPVRTGALRASIARTPVEQKRGGFVVRITADVPYARFVEYGGARTPAHAFLRPAARASSKRIPREVKKRFPKR
jgi:HK97 gp10 family phage protein